MLNSALRFTDDEFFYIRPSFDLANSEEYLFFASFSYADTYIEAHGLASQKQSMNIRPFVEGSQLKIRLRSPYDYMN